MRLHYSILPSCSSKRESCNFYGCCIHDFISSGLVRETGGSIWTVVSHSAVIPLFSFCCLTSRVGHCMSWTCGGCFTVDAVHWGVRAATAASNFSQRPGTGGNVARGMCLPAHPVGGFLLLVHRGRMAELAAVAALRARPEGQVFFKAASAVTDVQELVTKRLERAAPRDGGTTVPIPLLGACRLASVINQRAACVLSCICSPLHAAQRAMAAAVAFLHDCFLDRRPT